MEYISQKEMEKLNFMRLVHKKKKKLFFLEPSSYQKNSPEATDKFYKIVELDNQKVLEKLNSKK